MKEIHKSHIYINFQRLGLNINLPGIEFICYDAYEGESVIKKL